MRLRLALASSLLLVVACDGGGVPIGWRATPDGTGPRVTWDLEAEGMPIVPIPSDTATWPDPTSPTGRRINVSMVVPTHLERRTRQLFDELDGWGTFAPISVAFDAPIDVEGLLARQGGSNHFHEADFPEHAVYLIDLETGLPVPLDLNSGNFPYGVVHTDQYFENDPLSTESNLLFETKEEDANGNGVLDSGEDGDYDGLLDHPNTLDGTLGPDDLRTYDRMAWFYERQTRTLIVRPLLPLRQRTTYAVVLTDRLKGADGEPVRSPFDAVHHSSQRDALAPLAGHFAAHPELYGTLATTGWNGVAFAWTFTTQSVTSDLDTIREGLYGRGSMARLAEQFPADTVPLPMQGGPGCPDPGARVFIAPGDAFRDGIRQLATVAFDLSPDATEKLVASYATLDHVVTVLIDSPYFFKDPENEELEDAFDLDYRTGRARVTGEVLTMTMYIPKEDAEHQQPFAPVMYMHGHGSNAAEVLTYGGLVMQHGNALVTINAHGHGLQTDTLTRAAIRSALGGSCLLGMADAFMSGRARDLNGDGDFDSGADFWTAYIFHTRDSVRQTVVDEFQAFRALRSFDGRLARARTLGLRGPTSSSVPEDVAFTGDYDADGTTDLAGDFDGNGTPDLGGPTVPYGMAGGSLGGIIAGLTAGAEPMVTASTPVVGGGGLADVAIRTENGSVLSAMILRIMGPLVVGLPSSGGDNSSCPVGDISLAIRAPGLDSKYITEFACLPAAGLSADDVLFVRNRVNGEVACSGVTNDELGRFRVPVPSDAGDRWTVELYRGARPEVRFGECTFVNRERPPAPDRVIDTWEVGNGSGANSCASCARFDRHTYERGEPLTSPAAGFGLRRQTPEFRRLVMLAQIGLERGDPINYVGRIFLDPLTAPDIPVRPRSVLVTHTDGDPNVVIATGYSMARAAGVLPFLPWDAPPHLADYRAPEGFAALYPACDPACDSPNDVLLQYHAIEALPRLARHPVASGEEFLVDVDDLAEGRATFGPDGQTQVPSDAGGVLPVTVNPPLRWSRQSRAVTSPTDDVWSYGSDRPTSGIVSPYVQPAGIHGFRGIYDDTLGFDMAVYMFNMLGRYLGTDGRDIPYLSDPTGHQCLEDSSCSYIRR
jgi:hypothetical protein